ncbi:MULTISPECIES: LysR substrate-binding domain-containing protein [Leisingera]|jgi:LysR family glycine cleavage system transcriptional activator|uniref:LysR substrate-binding domain-containing protein n=1 Tax=Leisingera TaxID=191028 RepID=UPI001153FC38|nr:MULTISPECIES: LysR substrate-binding domain-containing protein [Leisingera]QDI74367.1 LysR family transcriptional regulator [Leisingera aquaemixtae]
MITLPHVTWLKAFEAAARLSSFSAAAAELGLTPAAVSQQIRLLEQHLNTRLFKRLPRGVALTDTGQAYAQPIRKSFDDMQRATTGLFSSKRKRVVRLRATISCAALVIAPQLARFRAEHPDIFVQLSTTVWASRFDEEALDIDIRYGSGDWQEAQILHLGHESAIPVCSPAYAAALGGAPSIEDLARADVVQIIGSETDWGRLADLHGLTLQVTTDWLKADSSLLALQTVAAGHGVTMVLESFAKQYLDQGLVIAPAAFKLPKRRSHYLVINDRAGQREEVKAAASWLMSLYQALT